VTDPAARRSSAKDFWSGSAVRLHVTALIVVPGCLAAGGFELSRALAGNPLSWAYVFEWPFFAVFCVRIWWRLWHEERATAAPAAAPPTALPTALPAFSGAAGGADDDPQLRAWQDYLARLHAEHPPGGPPARQASLSQPPARRAITAGRAGGLRFLRFLAVSGPR
jgi:hypothetical protein